MMRSITQMKKRLFGLFTTGLAVVLFMLFAVYLFGVFREKDETGKNIAFVEDGESYDVFWMGTSHMSRIQPVEVWKEYGITSYNLYNTGSGMNRNLATLEMALTYATPKVVVLDTDQWWREKEFAEEPGDFHRTFDIFPLSRQKIKAVCQITDDPEARKELLFDFYRYHDRYRELKKEDFFEQKDTCLGAHLYFDSVPQKEPARIGIDELPDDEDNEAQEEEAALRAVIEMCQSRGINIMLTCLPFAAANESTQKRQHVIYQIAQEYNIPYYNFVDHESVIDYTCDFEDPGHLNLMGSPKVTKVLVDLIKYGYGLEDHRKDPEIAARWEQRVRTYEAYMDEVACDPEVIGGRQALVMLNLPQYGGEVYIKNSMTGMLHVPGTQELLENAVGTELPVMRKAAEEGLDYLLITYPGTGTLQEYSGPEIESMLGPSEEMENLVITLRNAETLDVVAEIREE